MASKRLLKKRVNRIVVDLLDDCDYLIVNEAPNADEADKLIDDAVAFYEDVLNNINKAEDKKAFREIVEAVDMNEKAFIERLNKLQS